MVDAAADAALALRLAQRRQRLARSQPTQAAAQVAVRRPRNPAQPHRPRASAAAPQPRQANAVAPPVAEAAAGPGNPVRG